MGELSGFYVVDVGIVIVCCFFLQLVITERIFGNLAILGDVCYFDKGLFCHMAKPQPDIVKMDGRDQNGCCAGTVGTKYIGIAVNKTTQTEGADPSEYTWSLFKGADGESFTPMGNWKTGS